MSKNKMEISSKQKKKGHESIGMELFKNIQMYLEVFQIKYKPKEGLSDKPVHWKRGFQKDKQNKKHIERSGIFFFIEKSKRGFWEESKKHWEIVSFLEGSTEKLKNPLSVV